MSIPSLLILPGDGIGPEVMAEVRKVISWLSTERSISFEVSEDLVGGAAYDTHGVPLHDDTMARAQAADAVLLGAVGGPNMIILILISSLSVACYDCAKKWIYLQICALHSVLTHSLISPHLSAMSYQV